MEVMEKRMEGIVVLSVRGRIDSNTSDEFEKMLLSRVQAGENRLILDFQELDYISSAGLRVLLKATKELKKTSGQMCLCSIRDYIQEVLDMSGFSSFLPIHPDLGESLRGLARGPGGSA
ncbi:MAG: STAS domain-containing protein [Syntrophobacteraceae bacterium]|jgi:anti-sigma B factor antagonist|nr:STAS domain-containing protein [Syntrophobacteraceae bacterium]